MDKKDKALSLGYSEMTQALSRLALVVVLFYVALVKEGLDPRVASRIMGVFAAEACRGDYGGEDE